MCESLIDLDFMNQFFGESDRGAAITSAAILDDVLRLLIASFLIEDQDEINELLGSDKHWDRPLGTLSARTRAAYCLGLISRDEFHDLGIIRRIRNDFAHGWLSLSFEDKQIKNRCNSLRIPRRHPDYVSLPPRDRFLFATGTLVTRLSSRVSRAANERRRVLPGPEAL